MDPQLVFAVAFAALFGVLLVVHGVTVYHPWFFGSNPRVVQMRRRLYWWFMRERVPSMWAMPAGVPLGLGSLAVALGAWLLGHDQDDPIGLAAALIGLAAWAISFPLAWLRPSWFLAGWHQRELERERAGLQPLMPMPEAGPRFTMTHRERALGFVMVVLAIAGVAVGRLGPAALIGLAVLLGILATARIVDRHSQ